MKIGYIILLSFLFAFSIGLSGCNNDMAASKQSDSAVKEAAIEQTPSSSMAQETKNPDDELYKGLNRYEPGFKLEDFPVIYKSRHAVIRSVKGCMTLEQLETAGKEIDEAIEKLERYLKTSLDKKWNSEFVTYFIKPGELQRCIGSYSKPVVFLNPQDGKLPLYVHETTHLLAGCKNLNSTWMSEGLAVYLNYLFSTYPTWPSYDKDIDIPAKQKYESGYKDVANFEVETFYTNHYPTGSEGEAYYILAGSFVKYIVVNAGIDKFMAAYKNYYANVGLMEQTGKSLLEWKTDWIDHLMEKK